MDKIKAYHFHNGKSGGVHSVISNLTQFSADPRIEHHVIYTINTDTNADRPVSMIRGAVSEQFFYYSASWNFYHTCKKLATLLPGEALVIAHDWMELGMMSNLGLQNPVIYFVHGDYEYYYTLAQKHGAAIDFFITVAGHISTKLLALLPHRPDDIIYLRFPVAQVTYKEKRPPASIIFIGRLEEAKGYPLLPAIAKKLKEKNLPLHWHIAGTAAGGPGDGSGWEDGVAVKFYGNLPNEDVLQLLQDMHLLILPSLFEGTPVAIIEAMKAGVIPVVNNIEGGIQELVIDGKTGYKIQDNAVDGYAEKILEITGDKALAGQMRNNCVSLANTLFDPVKNTALLEDAFVKVYARQRRKKHPVKVYGSRLDQPWLPNVFTHTLRKRLKSRIDGRRP